MKLSKRHLAEKLRAYADACVELYEVQSQRAAAEDRELSPFQTLQTFFGRSPYNTHLETLQELRGSLEQYYVAHPKDVPRYVWRAIEGVAPDEADQLRPWRSKAVIRAMALPGTDARLAIRGGYRRSEAALTIKGEAIAIVALEGEAFLTIARSHPDHFSSHFEGVEDPAQFFEAMKDGLGDQTDSPETSELLSARLAQARFFQAAADAVLTIKKVDPHIRVQQPFGLAP